MRTVSTYLTLAFCLLPLCLSSAVAADNHDTDQDKLIETLTKRVKRLEEIVGKDEHSIPTKPPMGEWLDRIEREFRENQREGKSLGYDLKHDVRQLSQAIQETGRRVDELTARMDRAEREADGVPGADDLWSLQRDVERLQRQLDNLSQKLGKGN